ncbi:MAG: restriction endonuclease subunit S [Tateyamaria sp.]|jgi:type I restriction enzyme S subunit|uniref:restriction endonuclease subunit S n=1 Tax=Tateyamaria sp. TaxID=1929288 RepID=UPI0032DC4FD6
MSWSQIKLEEIVAPQKASLVSGPFGSSIGSRFFVPAGVPVIRGNNLSKGSEKFIDDGYVFLTEEKATEFPKCVAIADDLIFTAAGSIGQVGIIPKVSKFNRYIISNKQIRLRLDRSKADPLFVYYWLSSRRMVAFIESQNNGGAVPLLNLGIIRRLPVPLPDLSTQERIAGVLSAYDDLIENNRRRIALLEQAARLLYREWFVHFRFPGSETTKFVDRLPEGWSIIKVEEAVTRHPPGKLFSQKTVLQSGTVPVLDQGQSGIIGYHNEQPSFSASTEDPVIVFSNHTCYQRVIHFPFSAIQNVLPFKPSDNVPDHVYWLHHATEGLVSLNAYKGHWPEFKIKDIALPPAALTLAFNDHARSIHLQIYKLNQEVAKLTKARDLLLPRLMDGRLPIPE